MKYKANPVQVEAHRIIEVGIPTEAGTSLKLENGAFPVDVAATPEMTARMLPVPGDYWVVQSDGYVYLNPKAVFERKYSPVSGLKIQDSDNIPCNVEHKEDSDEFMRGVESVLRIRCTKHRHAAQLNTAEEGGGECPICYIENLEGVEKQAEPLVPFFDFLLPADGPVVEGMEEVEVKFAESQPQYITLRTLTSNGPERKVLSRWAPTPGQREAVARGADVYLELMTFGHPLQPIRMGIGYKPNPAFIMNLLWPDLESQPRYIGKEAVDKFKQAMERDRHDRPQQPDRRHGSDDKVPGPHKPPKPPGHEVG